MWCLLCKRTGNMFTIHTIYPNANHSVKEDIIEIFGIDVEPYLNDTDRVCNVCMNVIYNVVKLKRRLWQVISDEKQDCKPINLGKIWELFATFKREDNREEDNFICRTPTPSNLLTLRYSRDYNHTVEDQIAHKEQRKSMSRTSSGLGRSSETSEIRNILFQDGTKKKLLRRKRRKGHNWTRRKNYSKSPTTSEFSHRTFPVRTRTRSDTNWNQSSPLSECSYVSYYSTSKESSPSKSKMVQYDAQGRLTRKRTRSVSKQQEEDTREQLKQLEQLETIKFYCFENDCLFCCESLDLLTDHKIENHNVRALYYCEECCKNYTTAEHLKLHKELHDRFPFWCPLCLAIVQNQQTLQNHLQEHASYSVPCKYCDKSFLSRTLRDNHLKSAHVDKRERIFHRRKIIIDRIDKDKVPRVNQNSPLELEGTLLDVTTENLRAMNIDFIQCNEYNNDMNELTEPETSPILSEVT